MINRYKKLKTSDIFTLERVQTWQKFYENETECNPDNPTAPILCSTDKKIAELYQVQQFIKSYKAKGLR